jgi:LacI family transcriptional regulator
VNQRTSLIGLLVPDASNPFFAAIARKATVLAERFGMSTLLADSHDSIEHEKDLLANLQSRQVEGLIICPIGDSSSHLKGLARSGANVVVVDRWFSDVPLITVTSENEGGARTATNPLVKKGHRVIGCLQGRPGTSTNDERLKGYNGAKSAFRLPATAILPGK